MKKMYAYLDTATQDHPERILHVNGTAPTDGRNYVEYEGQTIRAYPAAVNDNGELEEIVAYLQPNGAIDIYVNGNVRDGRKAQNNEFPLIVELIHKLK